MDLKTLDLDAVASSLNDKADSMKANLEAEVKAKLEQIHAAVDTARMLEKLPTGELIQRAALAEVIPISFLGAEVQGLLSGSIEMRFRVTGKDGVNRDAGWSRLEIGDRSRGAQPPVVKPHTPYRLLLFLLEQKP